VSNPNMFTALALNNFCSSSFSTFSWHITHKPRTESRARGLFQALDEAVGRLPSGVIRVSGCGLVFAEALPPST
jgi:hypothetical protein